MIKLLRLFIYNLFFSIFILSCALGEIIKEIYISGNDRIPDETVLMFSDINVGDDLKKSDLNIILKNLYDSNFFKNISLKFTDGKFLINIVEAPLIQNINISGLKAKKFEEMILSNRILKPKSSFNNILLNNELDLIKSLLKSEGFYFSTIDAEVNLLENNLVNINYKIDLGDKSKISKISFIGDKFYKNKKLKDIIVSEEYKIWKFLSNKKFLREELIALDIRLLKSFYLNNGFYNVKINSSFAKLINTNEFELIFNIDTGKKFFFDDLEIVVPSDFDKNNFSYIDKLFEDLKNKPYSINSVDKILSEIDKVTINEEFRNVNAFVDELINDNKINITFKIEESEKFIIEKINIFGNNVTRENVIRNQLEIDEGDIYSSILAKKSENNIKGLNFFRNVKTETINGKTRGSKIININIEEKPTGEISAGAGGGTEGGTIFFGVKENNYLGKGLAVNANATVTSSSFKGLFGVTNPNFNNSDKSIYANVQAVEIDQLKKFGYKTNKNGFEIGTSFEYLDDFNLGISTSTFFEKIETNSTASVRQKKQAGNYMDTFLNFNFLFDARDQKYKPTDGYFSNYSIKLPIISDTNTLTNSYNYKVYTELYNDNISSFSILLKNATSISNNDAKLTERLFIPSNKLRGFESGKVGPKDGNDFIGGNYFAAINLESTLPVFFKNSQNLDAKIFMDVGNIWGVDYDSSIDSGDKIRSSIGIGVDWLTIVGPLNFSITEVISKTDTDIEESFRFNLGTTF